MAEAPASQQNMLGFKAKLSALVATILAAAYAVILIVTHASPHPFDGFADRDGQLNWPRSSAVSLTSESPLLKAMAARTIRHASRAAADEELRTLLRHNNTPEVKVSILEVIGDLGLASHLDEVERCAKSKDTRVRTRAIWALGGMGKIAIPSLLKLMRDDSLRPFVAMAFERIGNEAIEELDSILSGVHADHIAATTDDVKTARSWASRGTNSLWGTTSNGLTIRLSRSTLALSPGRPFDLDVEIVNISDQTIHIYGLLQFEHLGKRTLRDERDSIATEVIAHPVALPPEWNPDAPQSTTTLTSIGPASRHLVHRMAFGVAARDGVGNILTACEPYFGDMPLTHAWRVRSGRYHFAYTFGDNFVQRHINKSNYTPHFQTWIGFIEADELVLTIDIRN